MTEEEFEIKLRDKINNALETEQEVFDESRWFELENRLSNSRIKKRLFYYMSAAAVILVFIAGGTSIFLFNKDISKKEMATNKNPLKSERFIDLPVEQSKQDINKADEQLRIVNMPKTISTRNINTQNKVADNVVNKNVNEDTYKNINEGVVKNESKADQKNTMENDKPVTSLVISTDKQTDVQNAKVSDESLIKLSGARNLVQIGASVSSIVNYDQANHNTSLHLGGGLVLEFNLLDNLAISTGVQLTNQTINFQNVEEQSLALGKHVKTKDLQLLGLDFPINVKYRFNLANTKMFVSSGISSLTFIKEDIQTKYDVRSTLTINSGPGTLVTQTVTKEETETNSLGSFNDFFFAKVLNLSFGVEIPIYSKNVLIFEPYLKYSLGHLKRVEVRPSVLGINVGILF